MCVIKHYDTSMTPHTMIRNSDLPHDITSTLPLIAGVNGSVDILDIPFECGRCKSNEIGRLRSGPSCDVDVDVNSCDNNNPGEEVPSEGSYV